MPSVRLMPPNLMFKNAMQLNTATTSQGRGTITKGEAENAVAELSQHPLSSPAERAQIVQSFLDGTEGKALSPKAREVLKAFVARETAAPGGQRADELKATATSQARAAETTLQAAKARLDALLAEGGRVKKSELAPVQQALDGARAAVDAARGALSGAIQVADHTAQLADRQLKDAQKELKKAQADVARLAAQKGGVTKKAVEDVTRWLNDPLAELQAARAELRGGAGDITTEKFPSDNEDGGGGGVGEVVTKRYPSDDDAGGSGGVMSTMKYPSDNEDGGGVNEDGSHRPGPAIGPMITRKFPSDHEDGGGVNEDGTHRPGPAVGPSPNTHTTTGGAGDIGHAVTLKFPSDNEDGGGGMMTTMKAPSDHEDGGPGPAPTDGTTGGPTVKPTRTDAMLKTFGKAEAKGLKWHNSMPLGQRFETVLLKRERHPDGFAFEAMIPVGALTPTAPRQDPNTVDTFWVRRTGGIAGLTQYAGPFSLTPPDGSAKI